MNVTKMQRFPNNSEVYVESCSDSIDYGSLAYRWLVWCVLCQAIDLFGIISNVINVICFVKQGFKDPVNVSFLGLAISDLGFLIFVMWTNVCQTPAFNEINLPFDPIEVQYLTGGIPHVTFIRISNWITALITLERCLCISLPLKVKDIITSQRMFIFIVFVYVFFIASVTPLYVVTNLSFKFYSHRNRSLVGLVYTSDAQKVGKLSFQINNVSIPLCAFIVIIVCTVILVVKLKQKNQWRKKSAVSTQADNLSSANMRVAKMVVMISTLYIACFTPVTALFVAMSLEPKLAIDGELRHILIMTAGLIVILESLNSSLNIFIYYHMSGKYREVFLHLLPAWKSD